MKQANAKLRPDGRWEARAVINGKRQSFYGERQQDAIKAMRAAQKAADDGIYTEPTRFTLAKWLDVWISEYVQPSCKPLTVSTYRNRINVHIKPKLGQIKLSELTPTQIQQFYNNLTRKEELSPKTVKNIHGILHKCLAQAVKLRYLAYNPADACELPRMEKKEIQPLTEQDISAFLQAIEKDEPYRDLFTVTLFTGLREGEVCGLSWDAVNFKDGTITVKQQLQKGKEKGSTHYISTTKSGKARTITAAPMVMDILKRISIDQKRAQLAAGSAWDNTWNLVFVNAVGHFTVPQTLRNHFKRICRSIGLPDARFHDLRHTYACISLQEGDDLKTVQQNLGHATASFTLDVYGHVSEKMKQESADRMNRFMQKVKA